VVRAKSDDKLTESHPVEDAAERHHWKMDEDQ
jgi:hypothetical protein